MEYFKAVLRYGRHRTRTAVLRYRPQITDPLACMFFHQGQQSATHNVDKQLVPGFTMVFGFTKGSWVQDGFTDCWNRSYKILKAPNLSVSSQWICFLLVLTTAGTQLVFTWYSHAAHQKKLIANSWVQKFKMLYCESQAAATAAH